MHSVLRMAAFALVAGSPAVSMTTCFDIEHATTLYPDGSGKFAVSFTVLKENYKDKKWDSAEEFLAGCLNACEGYSAWSTPSLKEDETRLTYSVATYFEDIGKLRWMEAKGKHGIFWSFQLTENAKGHTLIFRDKILKDWIEAARKPLGPEEKECTSDDRYRVTITVPGKITDMEGFPSALGRVAEVSLDDKLKFAARNGETAATKRLSTLSPEMKVTWTESTISNDQVEAFKKERAAAKETWKAIEPRIRKIAEEKKKGDD